MNFLLFLKPRLYVFVIVIGLTSSCITSKLKTTEFKLNNDISDNYFDINNKAYIFKSNIRLYKNEFSGIFVVKPCSNNSYRTVFLNELGMKFFDIEISQDNYYIHKIFESLDRKSIIKLFVNDFRVLLYNNVDKRNSKKYKNKKGNLFIIKPNKNKELYYIDKEDELLVRIEQYSPFRKIRTIKFQEFNNKFPEKISMYIVIILRNFYVKKLHS
jgi:hypothetical protein